MSILKKFFRHIATKESGTVTVAAFILAMSALLSRVLGLFRDRILAGKFGAGDELDVYYAAFRIPDTIYSVLILGAVSSAFIPVFSSYLVKDKKRAWEFVSNILTILVILLSGLAIMIFVASPFLVTFVAPGFGSEKFALTVTLTRIMFVSPLIFGLSSVIGSVLQTFQRFLIHSLAPILYNIGIIIGALYFTDLVEFMGYEPVVGLACGVVFGAFLHLFVQLPGIFVSGFSFRPHFNIRDSGFLEVVRLAIPRFVGLGAYQINLIVTTAIASALPAGRIAVFNLASNLQYMPIGIIGFSFATAAFPLLSQSVAQKEKDKLIRTFSSTFGKILFLVLPLSVFIVLMRAQIVRLILGVGLFGWEDTRLTAASLGLFGVSIFAQSLIPLISKSFYSLHDTKTPVAVSIFSIFLNICLSFIFVYVFSYPNTFVLYLVHVLDLTEVNSYAVIGLSLAFSIANVFNFFVLLFFLKRRIRDLDMGGIIVSSFKILCASLFAGLILYLSLGVIAPFVNMETGVGVLEQTIVASILGGISYLVFSLILRSQELATLSGGLRRRFVF